MFCEFLFEDKERNTLRKGTTYWLDFDNDASGSGEIWVSVPARGRANYPIWDKKYAHFEAFLEDWRIV